MQALNRENAFVRLAGLLAARASAEFGSSTDPSAVAAVLSERVALDSATAESLVWGRLVEISPETNGRLADALSLHPGLLGCVLLPSSWEGVEHGLREAQRDFCNQDCGVCDLIAERTFLLDEEGEGDPLEVCLDALEHLRAVDDAPASADLDEDDRLAEIMNVLPEASRLRVMAFAYQELAEVTSGQPLGQFAAYARLRQDYLTPLSRHLLDCLACSPEGEMTALEIQQQLKVDGRELSQLIRSVSRSVSRLGGDGYQLHEEPLELRRPRPRDRRLRLRPRALSAWRSLLRAEEEAVAADPLSQAVEDRAS